MQKRKSSPLSVFLAVFLAIPFGIFVGKEGSLWGVTFFSVFEVLGTLFLNALTLVVVPLVSSSIITGVAKIGNDGAFGRLGAKMFSFYLGTSLMAILIGLFFVNLIGPGYYISFLPEDGVHIEKLTILKENVDINGSKSFIALLLSIIPSNILDAFSRGEMLGLIFFSILFGYTITRIEAHPAGVVRGFFQGVFQAMIEFTHIILKFLPYGVFCLVAKAFMNTGLKSLQSLGLFVTAVIAGLGFFMFIALPLLLKLLGRVNPLFHFKAMMPALMTAFSTSSSSATLPVTIDCVEKRAKVSNRICSLVVPLGNSINMSGSALYECVAALFVAQAYGIELSMMTQFTVVALSLITSMGVAGIPSGSLFAILMILRTIGLPAEGIELFIAVDRLLDMCRTTVNVFSDSCCAILIAKSEGEAQVLMTDKFELN